ncbi:hypothetical protein V6Z12_D11G221100 [Gossypium hirsutum]
MFMASTTGTRLGALILNLLPFPLRILIVFLSLFCLPNFEKKQLLWSSSNSYNLFQEFTISLELLGFQFSTKLTTEWDYEFRVVILIFSTMIGNFPFVDRTWTSPRFSSTDSFEISPPS